MSASVVDSTVFVAAVLTLYSELPETPLRPSYADQALARRLFTDAVPPSLIESALLLGTLRRLSRPSGLPPLAKIRSLAYFLPLFEELQLHPLPVGYLDYLRLKLRRMSA